ncbi:MAG: SusC/RagA family TonB-linked outer membrane protein [Cyclobacteriaceae bacterium]|nr:SusC/RagA family TonB-linked outer membrane protein [Cyclobacteriaceae bacterium]
MQNPYIKTIIKVSNYTLSVIALNCLMAGMLFASGSATSQSLKEVNITMQANEVRLSEVFEMLEQQSHFVFSYALNEVPLNKKISLEFDNENLYDVLVQISKDANVNFKRVNNQIAVKKQSVSKQVEVIDEIMQGITITGKIISSEDNEGLPGVNVVVQGTSFGTVTDVNGNYSLEVPSTESVLVFSSVGYIKEEVVVGNRSVIDLNLMPDITALEEIVVVGYGTIMKSDLTGSVAKVNSEELEKGSAASFDRLLNGKIAGVNIVSTSGAPGAESQINIRGFNGLGSADPLIVVDGYPIESSGFDQSGNDINTQQKLNPLSFINPSDIESIEVLKDASSTAIYGSRGANGVIMITTKSGKKGTNNVSYNFRFGSSGLRPTPYEMLSSREYMEYENEAATANGDVPEYTEGAMDTILMEQGGNINWQDVIFQTAPQQTHSLSFSGADEMNKYNIMTSYHTQEGNVINSNFERFTFGINASRKLSKKIEVGTNTNYVVINSKAAAHSLANGQLGSNVALSAIVFNPLEKIPDEDVSADDVAQNNPYIVATRRTDKTEVRMFQSKLFTRVELLKGLKLNFDGGINTRTNIRNIYNPRGTFQGDVSNGEAIYTLGDNFNYLTDITLSFNRNLGGKHQINAVGGWSYQRSINSGRREVAQGFLSDNLADLNFAGAGTTTPIQAYKNEWELASLLGRINYTYDRRFIATLTARYDGSTRLGPGNKWDFFPSGALGWNIHNEDFMDGIEQISNLKIRASYGLTGSQSIGVNSLVNTFGPDYYVVNGTQENALSAIYRHNWDYGILANNTLGWEQTKQFDVGIDIGLLDDRVNLTFDYYSKETTNLLLNLNVPHSSGYASSAANAGTVENKGLEIEANARLLTGEFQWTLGGNMSFNRNKLVELGPVEQSFGRVYANAGNLGSGNPAHILLPGEAMGLFYGYETDGIFQNQEQIDAFAQEDGSNPYNGFVPGDLIIKNQMTVDTNDDGVPDAFDGNINPDDRVIIGDPYPDFIFGITNTFTYKNFSLYVLVSGSQGNDILNLNRYVTDWPSTGQSFNIKREAYVGAWRAEGDDDDFPRLMNSGVPSNNRFLDRFVEDGSFIKIKNITFSYDFNLESVKYAKNLNLFVGADNLFIFTNYSGWDPEVSSQGGNVMNQAIDWGTYPVPYTIYGGFNVTF